MVVKIYNSIPVHFSQENSSAGLLFNMILELHVTGSIHSSASLIGDGTTK